MKINFKKPTNEKEILFIQISSKNKDEIVKESGKKTLYLKCEEKMNLRKLFLLVRKMVAMAKGVKAEKLAFDFGDFRNLLSLAELELAEIIGSQLDFANYEFTDYKTPPKEGFNFIKEIFITGIFPEARLRGIPLSLASGKKLEEAILKGQTIAEEVNKTRSLANTPGGDMTPQILAQKAEEAVKDL